MKKSLQIPVSALVIVVLLAACSKKNDNSPSSAASSWSFGGTSYIAATTVFTNNSLLGVSKANSQQTIGILFSSRPAAGNYTVVSNNIFAGQCSIQATGSGNKVILSPGGGTVKVELPNGKIHATFSGIPMVDVTGQASASISGDLTEQ